MATSVSAKEEEETTNKQINKRKREIEGFDLWVGTWITEILQLEVLCCQETSVRRSGSVQSWKLLVSSIAKEKKGTVIWNEKQSKSFRIKREKRKGKYAFEFWIKKRKESVWALISRLSLEGKETRVSILRYRWLFQIRISVADNGVVCCSRVP